jgi:hypothetical protein
LGGDSVRISDQFILRQIAGEYIIIPTGQTTLKFNGMITVNEQGAFLWEALKEEITEDALVDAVLAEYDTDRQTAQADVAEFLEVLRQKRILNE